MEEIIDLLNQFLISDSKDDEEKKWALEQTDDQDLKNAISQCDTREFRLIGLFRNTDVLFLKQLPDKLHVSQASSSRSTTKLQRLDIIDKFKNEDNKKEWQLRLTPKGKEILRIKIELDSKNLNRLKKGTENFSRADIETIIKFLQVVVNNKR